MAIALDTSTGWVECADFGDPHIDSSAINVSAGAVVFASVVGYGGGDISMSNNGGALTWTKAAQSDDGSYVTQIWWAHVPSGRTGLVVSVDDFVSPYTFPSLAVFSFTGLNTTTPCGTGYSEASRTASVLDLPNAKPAWTDTQDALFVVAQAATDVYNVSNATTYGLTSVLVSSVGVKAAAGYRAYNATPSTMFAQLRNSASSSVQWRYSAVELFAAGVGGSGGGSARRGWGVIR